MEVLGKISKINDEMGYGFIKSPKLDDVFFSEKTLFNGTDFQSLKVDDSVRVLVKNTDRGLFAESLSLAPVKSSRREKPPEQSI